jgi:hypothetical protein
MDIQERRKNREKLKVYMKKFNLGGIKYEQVPEVKIRIKSLAKTAIFRDFTKKENHYIHKNGYVAFMVSREFLKEVNFTPKSNRILRIPASIKNLGVLRRINEWGKLIKVGPTILFFSQLEICLKVFNKINPNSRKRIVVGKKGIAIFQDSSNYTFMVSLVETESTPKNITTLIKYALNPVVRKLEIQDYFWFYEPLIKKTVNNLAAFAFKYCLVDTLDNLKLGELDKKIKGFLYTSERYHENNGRYVSLLGKPVLPVVDFNSVNFYHITDRDNLAEISRKGLIPKKTSGMLEMFIADKISIAECVVPFQKRFKIPFRMNDYKDLPEDCRNDIKNAKEWFDEEIPPVVFVSNRYRYYNMWHSWLEKGDMVLLGITRKYEKFLYPDYIMELEGDFISTKRIPPEEIVIIKNPPMRRARRSKAVQRKLHA